MRGEPEIVRYMNNLAGTKRGGTYLQAEEIADYLIWRMAEARGRLEFDPADFDRLYASFCTDLRGDEVEFEAVAPLPNFKVGSAPVALDGRLEIDRLTDEEILRCLGVGLPMGFETYGTMVLYGTCGVRYHFTERKFFGEVQHDGKALQIEHERITAKFLEVSHALRLFKKGSVHIPAFAVFSRHWPVNNVTTSGPIEPIVRSGLYELSTMETSDFAKFWNDVIRARKVSFLDAAIRRSGYAGERRRAEDRLVDLMICAESLFLSDVGEAGERGEMRTRLSLRFGLFAAENKRLENFRL